MDFLHLLRMACQIAIAVGIVNVWLFRANSPSPYRGGSRSEEHTSELQSH